MPSVKHAGVLSPKVVEQALRAPFAATRVRFCACASRFETSPTRVRFVVRTFPDRGEASVELAAGNDLAPDFEACLGTIEARYRAFEIGSDCINCGTGAHQGVEIVYPLVVDLSDPQ